MPTHVARSRIDPLEVAQAVAPHLQGWRVEQPYPHCARLTHTDGRHLDLSPRDGRETTHITVTSWYPQQGDPGWALTYRLPRPRINVAVSRGPQVIAREITRRLLPPFEAGMVEFQARLERHTTAKAARQALTRDLVTSLAALTIRVEREERDEPRLTWYTPAHCGDIRIHPDAAGARFEIYTHTRAGIRALAHAIASALSDVNPNR